MTVLATRLRKNDWGVISTLYALILLTYSHWWNRSYYEKSEIKDLQFYIDIIFRIKLHWRLCHCQLIQLCFSIFTSIVCLLTFVCLLWPSTKYERTPLVHCITCSFLHNGELSVFDPFGQIHYIYNSFKTNSDDTLSRNHVRWYHRQTFYLWIILTCAPIKYIHCCFI
jgi:hypothetical protein